MAARKNDVQQQQKGGRRVASAHKFRPLSCYLLLTITLLTLFKHIDTQAPAPTPLPPYVKCRYSRIFNNVMEITKDIMYAEGGDNRGLVADNSGHNTNLADWCYILYNLDVVDRSPESRWNLEPFIFVAGGGISSDPNGNFFGIDVCRHRTQQDGCEVENTTFASKYVYWDNKMDGPPPTRLDFVCCCNTDVLCNDLYKSGDNLNSVLPQFTKRLNDTKQQACYVEYNMIKHNHMRRVDNCTRRTGQRESPETPSRCRSASKWGASGPEIGCAHDGTVDRCEWAKDEPSGVCRQLGGMLECCCTGVYCNGEAYMNLSCRAAIDEPTTSPNFKYGMGACKTPYYTPDTTMTNPTEAITTNTPPTPESNVAWTLVIILGVMCGILSLVVLVGCCICVVCYVRKQRQISQHASLRDPKSGVTELSGVTVNNEDRLTQSEKDIYEREPHVMYRPEENVSELQKQGMQSSDASRTINPNEGSDFGDNSAAMDLLLANDPATTTTTTNNPITTKNTDATTNNAEAPATTKTTKSNTTIDKGNNI